MQRRRERERNSRGVERRGTEGRCLSRKTEGEPSFPGCADLLRCRAEQRDRREGEGKERWKFLRDNRRDFLSHIGAVV